MTLRTATCCCGQLRIEVEGAPRAIGVCHCLECQKRTGSVFAALASFAAAFKVTGKATEYVRAGDQGARFRFRFCPVCGATLYAKTDRCRNLGTFKTRAAAQRHERAVQFFKRRGG